MQGSHIGDGIAFPAHREHPDYSGIGGVLAVFCPSVPLRDPDGTVVFSDDVTYVFRKILGLVEEFPRTGYGIRPLHLVHLVCLSEIDYHRADHQIGSERYLRSLHVLLVQKHLEEGCIQDDIPVVGDEKIALILVEIPESRIRKTVGRRLFDELHYRIHEHMLEFVDIPATEHHVLDFTERRVRENVAAYRGKLRICSYTAHRGRNLDVGIWSYIVKHSFFCYR